MYTHCRKCGSEIWHVSNAADAYCESCRNKLETKTMLGVAIVQTEVVAAIPWVEYFIHNPFRAAAQPYTDIMGFDFFITWILLAMGGALYLSERSLPQVVGYFMMVFLFLAIALNAIVLAIFGMVAALI